MKKNMHDIGDKYKEDDRELNISLFNFKKKEGVNDKVIHIKKTKFKGRMVHFFWNSSKNEVLKGMAKVSSINDFHSTAHAFSYNEDTSETKNRTEIQLGDSVFYYKKLSVANESFTFGYVTGIFRKNNIESIEITRTSLDKRINGSRIKLIMESDTPVFLLSNGYNDRYQKLAPSNNKLKIMYKYQIDSIEFILGNVRILHLMKSKFNNREYPLGEAAFKEIHKSMFGDIHHWAGNYREHEVVVGDRDRATVHQSEISKCMKSVFRRTFKNRISVINDIDSLSLMLTSLHKDLAWIHPFEDGNGRAIRFYLLILSLSLGFKMDVTAFTGDKKRKSFYHYAVRKAIYDNNCKYLHAIIKRSLTTILRNKNAQQS
ncbi:Fic family protein [Erwinia rhapontici]|uniref:Fic family protein n=1 Tax=Erwinia rhapontici TaxID=55212 RepID=UPI0021673575|nr:Fic family protein [Erwinia rhapontici]MCS3610026.1 cell filamentation protein [Erwinia rhapontici]